MAEGNLATRLADAVHKEQRRIVVIGDTMTDVWVHGDAEDCQDDCPKLTERQRIEVPGGAANAERSISLWRTNTSLYGWAERDRPTKLRLVDQAGAIRFRLDNDEVFDRNRDYAWCRRDALEMAWCAGAVLLSDYDKGFLTLGFIQSIVGVCREHGIPCVADCKRTPEVYAGCTLKGNMEYAQRFASNLVYEINMNDVVVTNGAKPPNLYAKNWYEPSELSPVECVNHVGAGDCFAAHLALALAYGFSLKEAAALAHSAGRIYVQHPYNEPPSPQDIAEDLSHLGVISTSTP